MEPKLPFHEWAIVGLLIIALASIVAVAFVHRPSSLPVTEKRIELVNKNIVVEIHGAVQKPGVYELPKGSRYKDLFAQAIPQPHADLRKFKMQSALRSGQTIHVPPQVWITVNIEGAVVAPGAKEVLEGTTLSQLSEEIAFAEDADRQKLQKKRKLKEGEIIRVPKLRKKIKKALVRND